MTLQDPCFPQPSPGQEASHSKVLRSSRVGPRGDPLDYRCEDPNLKALTETRAALRE